VDELTVSFHPHQAIDRNVAGRSPISPVSGFGQLWQKIYWLQISDPAVTPEAAVLSLKEHFCSKLQPSYNRFYPSAQGIKPGELVLIDSSTPGGPVSTGVMILYADDYSFTFITPQGHPEAGMISFSSFYEDDGRAVVQILGLARANDPVYEAAFRAVGSKMQVRIWTYVLHALAEILGVDPDISVHQTCVDPHLQWSAAGNIWYNAQIRTLLYSPVYYAKRLKKQR